jgi:hypothetical protein
LSTTGAKLRIENKGPSPIAADVVRCGGMAKSIQVNDPAARLVAVSRHTIWF